jgi:hypothetical protein
MPGINPYESPNSVGPQPLAKSSHCVYRLVFRLARTASLAAIGYCVYFAGIYVAAHVEPSVSLSEVSWTGGGVVAFAFASSEIFYLEACRLNTSFIRRLIVSCALTIFSLVAADPLCTLVGIELRRNRSPLVLPRFGIGLPVFAMAALLARRWLSRGRA